VLPIGFSAPPAHVRPSVTAGLALALVAVLVHVQLLEDAPRVLFCSDLTESPQAVAGSSGTLQGFVCRYGVVPDEVQEGRHLHSLVTASFVHTGLLHLMANLLFLGAFAPRVEEDLGHPGLLLLFLTAGAAGAVGHVLTDPTSTDPVVGASGGVAGVLGAHLLLAGRQAQVRVLAGPLPVRLPTWFAIALWALLQLAYTIALLRLAESTSSTAYPAHVVGFLVGFAAVADRVADDRAGARAPRHERPGAHPRRAGLGSRA
jgi:membrane associated rhomboid family serine protease